MGSCCAHVWALGERASSRGLPRHLVVQLGRGRPYAACRLVFAFCRQDTHFSLCATARTRGNDVSSNLSPSCSPRLRTGGLSFRPSNIFPRFRGCSFAKVRKVNPVIRFAIEFVHCKPLLVIGVPSGQPAV